MIHSSRFAALLDANILFPAPIRDLLLHLASIGLYKPKWTDRIHEEWIRNLLLKRTDLKEESLLSAKAAMDGAFPDANISNYELLIPNLILPDEKDRHVLAAAIKGGADVLVTFNIKDFPIAIVKMFDIEVQHPDDFIATLIQLDEPSAIEAFTNQVKSLKNPSQTFQQVLETISRIGLPKSAALLKVLVSI